ncbi:MAG: BtaA family protein [Rudanella sp.]|nr:BtaA family protein [Rudanella sp.]
MMHSEFYNVELDRLRYSLVWEDSQTLYSGLDIQPDDRVLLITSAGCNVLNALLKSPRQMVAVDLNPVQNALLLFKVFLITHHNHAIFHALMGFDGLAAVAPAFAQVAPTLPAEGRGYWTSFFNSHPEGILTAGKLEAYITGFFRTLDADNRQKLRQLIQFDNLDEQRSYFQNQLATSTFRKQFIHYFDEANLSKGRDPKLFKYAQESGGEAFYNRFVHHLSTVEVQYNFFFRFFLFGPEHLPEFILPPCYQPQNYAALRANLHRLTIVDNEAVDYLLSAEGQTINKASLSNIFEYTSQREFERVCRLLLVREGPSLRFVFWNLLQEQTAPPNSGWIEVELSNQTPQDTACFYFRNVRQIQPVR